MCIRRPIRAIAIVACVIGYGPFASPGWAVEPTAALLEHLRSGEVEVRRDAAAKIRLAEKNVQREALPVLIELLQKEKDGQVRLAVLDTVTYLGPDAEPAVPALVQTLRSDYGGLGKEELHQDYRSALALATVGKPAVEGLRGLLSEKKESVRAEAVMALGRIGPNAEAAVKDLIPLLGHTSERIRREASLALGRIGKPAIGPLVDAASGENLQVRALAVDALGHLPATDDMTRGAVLAAAHDGSPEVRAASTRSLARLGLPEDVVLPIIKENLRDEDELVRLATVDLLVGRPALLQPLVADLEQLLTSKNPGISRHAALLLRRVGPDSARLLLNALARKESRIDQIAEALGQVGRPAVSQLVTSLQDPEPRVRRGAALALGQVRPLAPGVVQLLTAGLNSDDPEMKASFLAAIGSLGPGAAEAVPAVRGLLKDESEEIRLQAISILSRSAPRDERQVGDLAGLLGDPSPRVQRLSIETIRALGPLGRKALGQVIELLKSPSTDVRLASAEFIGSHGQSAESAVPSLLTLLDDPTPAVRSMSAKTLGSLGKASQPALHRLASLLDDGQAEVRSAAALTLGSLELEPEAIRPHLAKALRDTDPDVRKSAMGAIQRLGPPGAMFIPDIILMAEKKENVGAVQRMLRRFERKGPDARSVPELVKQLDHQQEPVRLLAAKFLGLAGTHAQDAIPILEKMRDDPSTEIRKQAEASIEQIKKGSAPS
ncbi:HEAT repeat domain-containing protein [Isosphaeraceae bacterium EP7]